MVRSALGNVEHMARNTGGAKRPLAGRERADEVEKTPTHPGTIALLLLRLCRILDLRIARRSKPNSSQGTTSHARMLVRVGIRITFGAIPLTAGTTAVQKQRSLSSREEGGLALAFVTLWESRTSGAQSLTRATAITGGIIVGKKLMRQAGSAGSLPSFPYQL